MILVFCDYCDHFDYAGLCPICTGLIDEDDE